MREGLLSLDASGVLERTHPFWALAPFHVPFDELSSRAVTEAAIARHAATDRCVVVSAVIGGGKSSVLAAALQPGRRGLPDGFAPVHLPAAGAGADVLSDTHRFARYLVQRLVSAAEGQILDTDAVDRAYNRAGERRHRGRYEDQHVGALSAGGRFLKGEVRHELRRVGESIDFENFAVDAFDAVNRMLEAFRSHGQQPFIVVDDADALLRTGARGEVAETFLGTVIPALVEHLDCGFALGVQVGYRDLSAWEELGRVAEEVPIPLLDGRETVEHAIERMLRRRLEEWDPTVALDAVFAAEVPQMLALQYLQHEGSIRKVLGVAGRALQHTLELDADLIDANAVWAAIAEEA